MSYVRETADSILAAVATAAVVFARADVSFREAERNAERKPDDPLYEDGADEAAVEYGYEWDDAYDALRDCCRAAHRADPSRTEFVVTTRHGTVLCLWIVTPDSDVWDLSVVPPSCVLRTES